VQQPAPSWQSDKAEMQGSGLVEAAFRWTGASDGFKRRKYPALSKALLHVEVQA